MRGEVNLERETEAEHIRPNRIISLGHSPKSSESKLSILTKSTA